jgi:hypothetical protein
VRLFENPPAEPSIELQKLLRTSRITRQCDNRCREKSGEEYPEVLH